MSAIRVQDLERDVAGSLRRVEAGETLVITRDDRVVAELIPAKPSLSEPRPVGLAAGQIQIADDFDAPLPDDILDSFEGR